MGLYKQYLKYGKTARDHILGISKHARSVNYNGPSFRSPLSMLISNGAKFNNDRIAVIILGIITLVAGILLTSVPWLDYFILKNLRLWNNTLSFHYWQRPGVIRLTKVYIFNVTNPEGFLLGEKPKLVEVGPFVYREDMEKVNIRFYENNTVSYQHKKILEFVPELSVDKTLNITTPNIPLLTLSSQSNSLGYFVARAISLIVTATNYKPFISLTADQLVFGYDDTLVSLAHTFYPRSLRPLSKMGLLNGRNGTLAEISTIHTGHNGMDTFGYLDRLNGMDHLPFWEEEPCTNIRASEGSFFPPRFYTRSNIVHVYDKDLCRILPMHFKKSVVKDGISANLYEPPDNIYGDTEQNINNSCYNINGYVALKGLQNISPCHYGAPVYISNPHFYKSHSSLLTSVDGLQPSRTLHQTFFKIQHKLGVPLEGMVRVQLNLKVDRSKNIQAVKDFRDFIFPIMWLEEGVSELTPPIRRWVYLATVFAPVAIPIISYGMMISGSLVVVYVFLAAYKTFVFKTDPTFEILEMGRRSIRRGSSFLIQHQPKFLIHRDNYLLLKTSNGIVTNKTKN